MQPSHEREPEGQGPPVAAGAAKPADDDAGALEEGWEHVAATGGSEGGSGGRGSPGASEGSGKSGSARAARADEVSECSETSAQAELTNLELADTILGAAAAGGGGGGGAGALATAAATPGAAQREGAVAPGPGAAAGAAPGEAPAAAAPPAAQADALSPGGKANGAAASKGGLAGAAAAPARAGRWAWRSLKALAQRARGAAAAALGAARPAAARAAAALPGWLRTPEGPGGGGPDWRALAFVGGISVAAVAVAAAVCTWDGRLPGDLRCGGDHALCRAAPRHGGAPGAGRGARCKFYLGPRGGAAVEVSGY
ncbi:MAG: hypothetical protein J3K34DRAFT_515794 [Monoraphidium minutum]|nr:MAG: hypothetical protein J3K34DRAFT_515794 [Monoraphidium minutum]